MRDLFTHQCAEALLHLQLLLSSPLWGTLVRDLFAPPAQERCSPTPLCTGCMVMGLCPQGSGMVWVCKHCFLTYPHGMLRVQSFLCRTGTDGYVCWLNWWLENGL